MAFNVLVVDDSHFFQRRLKSIINENPELHVIGVASDGREAVEKAKQLRPDIITMDFEMPVMDGITAIKHILANRNVPILMYSSLTYEGARITLDALAAGALDFIPKDFSEISRNSNTLKLKLHERLLSLLKTAPKTSHALLVSKPDVLNKPNFFSVNSLPMAQETIAPSNTASKLRNGLQSFDSYRLKRQPTLIIIGASTGGPVALTEVLTQLPANFPVPIVLVQHMPESFTKAFAERLDRQCNISVREAADGDLLTPGVALLAPGGKQLMLDKRNGGCVRVFTDNDRATYKPSLDITFGSAANHYGGKVLGVVLTGMGSDGCQGARLLKDADSSLWSQDEASCVIYGMPMAVARAGLSDRVLTLKDIGIRLAQEVV